MAVTTFINLRKMPTGRHRFSLQQIRERADLAGFNTIVEKIDRALTRAQRTQRLELRYAESKNSPSKARGEAQRIDKMIDEQLVAIYKFVDANRIGDDSEPAVKAAKAILTKLFPAGVGAITQQAFEVQLSTMDTMMEVFATRLSTQVQTLHLERHLNRLGRLIEDFRAELNRNETRSVTFEQVRAARDDLHSQTCKVVAAIIATLDEEDSHTVHQRDQLLAPLRDQQARVADARRRQRQPTDIDPETGEELTDQDPVLHLDPEPITED